MQRQEAVLYGGEEFLRLYRAVLPRGIYEDTLKRPLLSPFISGIIKKRFMRNRGIKWKILKKFLVGFFGA